MVHVTRPHHILDEGSAELPQSGALLDIKHDHLQCFPLLLEVMPLGVHWQHALSLLYTVFA